MNRLLTSPLRLASLLGVSAVLLCLGTQVMAQSAPRPFPPAAQRGTMQITRPPELLMNGQPERLSPGARIVGANNMQVMSGTLIGQNLLVNFVREPQGLIHQVWILTPAEAQVALPTPAKP